MADVATNNLLPPLRLLPGLQLCRGIKISMLSVDNILQLHREILMAISQAEEDQARNICRAIARGLRGWEETRNNSLTLFEGLANAIIASGYLRGFGKYPGATEPSNDARWLPGEEGLHVRVDIKLWLQRLRDHHRLQVQLRKMNEYVSNLRESLLTVRSCPEPVRDVFKETINISYLQELLEEVVEALDAEGKLCEQILRQTGQTTTYKSQVVYSSAWAARPLLHDHRQRALKDLLELVLQDKKGV